MERITIDAEFRVAIPESLRASLHAGDALFMSTDEIGRLILTPAARIQAVLAATAGLWSTHEDATDGVAYVESLRLGHRLDRLTEACVDGD